MNHAEKTSGKKLRRVAFDAFVKISTESKSSRSALYSLVGQDGPIWVLSYVKMNLDMGVQSTTNVETW